MSPAGIPADRWSDGEVYEQYVGRWSRQVAPAFLSWLDPSPQLRWLDVGSGTGALSSSIVQGWDPAAVVGVDASAAYTELARLQVDEARARFEVGQAGALHFDAEFDAAVSGLVLNFVADPSTAVAGMRRAVVPGGVVAAYVWDYAERMEFMRYFWDAAIAVDPSAAEVDEAARFPVCDPMALADLWRDAGLQHVETAGVTVETTFGDFDDFWQPFLGGQGSAPTYLMTLSPDHRQAVCDRLRRVLPMQDDGSIHLVARAWAVKGRRPR